MHIYAHCACMHAHITPEVQKIIGSIPWTLRGYFNFLPHCLKAIAKYRNVHARLCTLCLHACTYHSRRALRIHWTLLSNFHFLHHPQIMHCLKAIAKYGNMPVYANCAHMHAHTAAEVQKML